MDNLAFARQGSGQWLMGELERWVWVGEWWGQQLNLIPLTYLTGIHVLQTSLNNFLAASISWVSNHHLSWGSQV